MSRLDYTMEHLSCNTAQIKVLNVINQYLVGTDVDKQFVHIKYVAMDKYVLSYYTNMDFLMETELTELSSTLTLTAVPQYGKYDHSAVEFTSPDISNALRQCILAGGLN